MVAIREIKTCIFMCLRSSYDGAQAWMMPLEDAANLVSQRMLAMVAGDYEGDRTRALESVLAILSPRWYAASLSAGNTAKRRFGVATPGCCPPMQRRLPMPRPRLANFGKS